VFAINTEGNGFRVLHHFEPYEDGYNPWSHLLLVGDTLFGTAWQGGHGDAGTVFSLKTDGSGFQVIHHFRFADGSGPMSPLIVSGKALFGMANNGGPSGKGAVFSLNTDGTGFTNLHFFTARDSNTATNADGMNPGNASLLLSGTTLYGTAFYGGGFGGGTVFKLNVDGTGFTVLHEFPEASDAFLSTNDGGAYPATGVILSGNTLYGTTTEGGPVGAGTVFALNTDGTRFRVLRSFSGGDGVAPMGGLVLSGELLYGMTIAGGAGDYGTVFSLSIRPRLSISTASGKVILSWPAEASSFAIESSTDLADWTSISAEPTTVDGRNTLIVSPDDASPGNARFYRLRQ
jgi:uncharacterized repeat protein (TIGR03803 family)